MNEVCGVNRCENWKKKRTFPWVDPTGLLCPPSCIFWRWCVCWQKKWEMMCGNCEISTLVWSLRTVCVMLCLLLCEEEEKEWACCCCCWTDLIYLYRSPVNVFETVKLFGTVTTLVKLFKDYWWWLSPPLWGGGEGVGLSLLLNRSDVFISLSRQCVEELWGLWWWETGKWWWFGGCCRKSRLTVIPIKTTHPCRILSVAVEPLEFQSQIQAAERVLEHKNGYPCCYCAWKHQLTAWSN